MGISRDKISFITANFVGRAVDYSLKPFDWSKADEATQDLFQGDAFEKEFDEIMRIISEAGFKTIGLWTAHLCHKVPQARFQKARQILARHGLSVCSYAGLSCKSEKDLEEAFIVAQTMGVKIMVGGLDEKLLDKAYQLCRNYKIRFAFENHPNIETPDKIKDMIATKRDWFGACVDTGWFATYNIDASEAIMQLEENLFHVHLKDIKRQGEHETCALGNGIVNIPGVINTLKKINYNGCISIEHEPEDHDPMEEIKNSLTYLYQLCEPS